MTELDSINCDQLKHLNCGCNLLTSLDLTNNCQLELLGVSNNNFSEQELSWLSHLVNLKELYLRNDDQEKIKQGIYNRFVGSLKFLKEANKLERLDINDTDIDSGIEYLPYSLNNYFRCSAKQRPEAKVKAIEQKLKTEAQAQKHKPKPKPKSDE